MGRTYQICTKCVMDTSDSEIAFDKDGVCNHCHEYVKEKKIFIIDDKAVRDQKLKNIITEIKESSKSKKYDCIVGISGGVDSSYVAYLAKKWGLRTLLVHLDNGWNSELAVKNIENIVKKTEFDLYTLVINWNEFKDLQRSFFLADVIDLEMLSDHAIGASVVKLTRQYKINYLLSGQNFVTEAVMPRSWYWRKQDSINIKAIHKKFGSVKLKTFPFLGTIMKTFYQYTTVAKTIPVLDYLDYNKEDVMKTLEKELDWQYYGGKHYESLFTRFYQGFILPKKFGVDKRRAHLSTLINSEQTTREKAIIELENEVYPVKLQEEDFELACKKLSFSRDEMNDYIKRPERPHLNYSSDEYIYQFMRKVYKRFFK